MKNNPKNYNQHTQAYYDFITKNLTPSTMSERESDDQQYGDQMPD